MMNFTQSGVGMMPIDAIWAGIVMILPKIILAILIAVVGILIGWLVKQIVKELFGFLRVDTLLAHTGLDQAMKRTGYKLDSGLFIGELIRWIFIVSFLVISFEIVGFHQVTAFLSAVAFTFVPNVIVASLIVLFGSIVADFVGKLVGGVVKATESKRDDVMEKVARIAIWVFTIIVALDQLGIARFYLQTFYQAVVLMAAIAVGLSFGLGGKDAASRFINSVTSSEK